MSNKIGKWFEHRVRESLKELQGLHGIFFHKLHDSHSAGRIVSAVPADFLVAYNGAQLWEAKASEVNSSLRSCLADMLENGQVASHRLWNRNGCLSFFIFYSDKTGMVEVWRSEDVIRARTAGRPLKAESVLHEYHIDSLRTCLWNVLAYSK